MEILIRKHTDLAVDSLSICMKKDMVGSFCFTELEDWELWMTSSPIAGQECGDKR